MNYSKEVSYVEEISEIRSYHEVLGEIKREVKSLDPFLPNSRVPSNSFCLLYKLYCLKLTENQMNGMLNSKESV